MNLTDLAEEFACQADDAPSLEAVEQEAARRLAARARRRMRQSLLAVAAAVVVVVAGAAALATMLPDHSDLTAAPVAAEDLVPVLAAEQRQDDRLPAGQVRTVVSGLDAGSTRLIGESEHAREWVGLDSEGNICLLVLLPNDVSGAGCSPPAVFDRRGTGVQVSGGAPGEPHRSASAYLLPSDVPESSVKQAVRQIRHLTRDYSGWAEMFSRDSTSVIVLSPNFAVDVGTVALTRSDGTDLVLHMG